jgi:hypothetical protein
MLQDQIIKRRSSWLVATAAVAETKMLDKTEQSDRAANPNEKPENCLRGPAEGFRPVSTLLYAMAGRPETPILPAPVIREKSQFRAQDDSLSLSPCS